jgi:hypothetical protein
MQKESTELEVIAKRANAHATSLEMRHLGEGNIGVIGVYGIHSRPIRGYGEVHGDIALDEKVAEIAEKTMQQWHHGKEMYPALLKTLLAIKREGVWPILTTLELMSDAVLSVTPYKYHGTVYGLTRNEWAALHCELECGNIFSNCESPDDDEQN